MMYTSLRAFQADVTDYPRCICCFQCRAMPSASSYLIACYIGYIALSWDSSHHLILASQQHRLAVRVGALCSKQVYEAIVDV
jgi:hypothetical protein